jgi:hypothetical protein
VGGWNSIKKKSAAKATSSQMGSNLYKTVFDYKGF